MTAPPTVKLQSLLDTDVYKLTMQQAVLHHFPDAQVTYKFTNRSKDMLFTRACVDAVREGITHLGTLRLQPEERQWLEQTCRYLQPKYLDYLSAFRFEPESQVTVHFTPQNDTGSSSDLGDLSLDIRGAWVSAILYEVPVMAIVSETYFRHDERDWSNEGQFELARAKGRELLTQGIALSEFGTRRRRSYATHAAVIEGLVAAQREMEAAPAPSNGRFLGTSNVLLAKQYGLRPVGTIAHEWTMAIAVLRGYARSNYNALHLWDEVYQPPAFTPANPGEDLTIALTDTFSTKVFWDDLLSDDAGREILRRWRGVRQDSGDSKAFVRHAHDVYRGIGVDPHKKVVIFSDSLNVPRCLDLAGYSRELGIGSGFGVGTNFTNDFHHASDPSKVSKALNIVLKLDSINGHHAVKISDELTKNTGDPHEVAMVKRRFGIEGIEHIEDA